MPSYDFRMKSQNNKELATLQLSSSPNKRKLCTIQLQLESSLIIMGTYALFREQKLTRAEKHIYTYDIIFHICNI
jgi:hypothetical protein